MKRIVWMGDIQTSPIAKSHRQDAMATVFVSDRRPASRRADRKPWHSSTEFQGRLRFARLAGLVLLAGATGCSTKPERLAAPPTLMAPYAAVLMVAPFTNESGVDMGLDLRASVSDKIITSLNSVKGWQAVPLNRTLQAMQQLGVAEIRSVEEAQAVLEVVGADGIIVGTITAWDPYDPPTFGANILLVADEGEIQSSFEARTLTGRTGDAVQMASTSPTTLTDVVGDYDATRHDVRQSVRDYARSHSDVTGGFEPPERYYLMVFDRWLDFSADQLVYAMLLKEQARVSRADAARASSG
jgi:hypothetical protein